VKLANLTTPESSVQKIAYRENLFPGAAHTANVACIAVVHAYWNLVSAPSIERNGKRTKTATPPEGGLVSSTL